VLFELDMHYLGQTHTVAAALPVDGGGGHGGADRAADPHGVRAGLRSLLQPPPARARHPHRQPPHGRHRPPPALRPRRPRPGPDASLEKARRGTRPVWFDGAWREAAIFARLDLPVGAAIRGPAVLEQPDATAVIDPDLLARVDRFGNVVVERA
jgi:N-methylhydantoinase A